MSELTARMLAKADRERAFRNLEEAAAQSQRDVRAGLRDGFGTPTKKGLQEVKPSMRSTPTRTPKKDRSAEIIAAYQDGTTIKRIALKLRISQVTVSKTLTNAGLRPALVRTTATPEEVVALYTAGKTITEIHAETRMPPERVSAAIKAAGVPIRPRNHLKNATACKRAGHDWTLPENVYNRPDGTRSCAECARQDRRAHRARKAAA